VEHLFEKRNMTMNKFLPAIAIAAFAFSGTALAQGAINGPDGSTGENTSMADIQYAPRDPKTTVPVVSNPGQGPAMNPAPGFLSSNTNYSRPTTIPAPRGLTKLKGPILDAYGNHVYAGQEVGSAKAHY
jgi:hypothetical protein